MYDNEYWREGPTTSTAALNEALSVCRLCRTFLQEGAWSEVDSLIHFPFQSEMPREVIAGTKAMMAQLIAEAEHSMEVSIWSTRMWDEALRREAQQLGRPMLTPSRAQAFVLAMDYVLPRWATEPMNVPEALNVVDTIYVVPVEMSRLAREASGQGALFFVLMGPEFGPGPPDPDLPMPRLVSLGAAEAIRAE